MSVEQGHTQDWQQTRVISPWIKVSEKENKKGRNASSAILFSLNYLLFTEGDEGFVLKKKRANFSRLIVQMKTYRPRSH